MRLFNISGTAVVTVAITLSLIAFAKSEPLFAEVSAPIEASATVINPVGMTTIADGLLNDETLLREIGADGCHRSLASTLLVRFPSEGSLFVQVETDGQLVDGFALPGEQRVLRRGPVDGGSLSGACLVERKAIFGSVPPGCTVCTVTLIYTEN